MGPTFFKCFSFKYLFKLVFSFFWTGFAGSAEFMPLKLVELLFYRLDILLAVLKISCFLKFKLRDVYRQSRLLL